MDPLDVSGLDVSPLGLRNTFVELYTRRISAMGNFYCNFTTSGALANDIVRLLDSQHRSVFITPTRNGRNIVFERESDGFAEADIETVGSSISRECGCPVLGAAVADDDELWLALCEGGRRTVEYSSRGAHRGAYAFSRAFGRVWMVPLIWILLQWPYVFVEHLRHAMLAKLLGIPGWCFASGYRYISGGEPPEGLTLADLQQTGQ